MPSQGYPSMEEVHKAGQTQLMRWSRYLPSPNDANRPIMAHIIKRQQALREANPAGYTHASKDVGFQG